jgi:hypothetical protein
MAVIRASSPSPQRTGSWLVLVASVGLVVPGSLFLYWVFHGFTTLQGALHDWLALAFIVDVFWDDRSARGVLCEASAGSLSLVLVSSGVLVGYAVVWLSVLLVA